jgi:very-short-patch-repair endonuclease
MVSQKTKNRRAAGQRLISNARRMRHEPTDAERKFWFAVRGRQFGGYKFKRQYPIGPYIADFVCLDQSLIVELDGGQHALQVDYDAERTSYLQSRGFRVLRFWNDDFLRTPDAILEGVWRALKAPSPVER